jgi:GH15 family glucan-1,4-alpha-glucosidase
LLGTPENGRWLIAPAGGARDSKRRYVGDTLILETLFETETGTVAVIDFMPPRHSTGDLVRRVEGRSGEVCMTMELVVRFGYGAIVPWVTQTRGAATELRAVAGPDMLTLRTNVPVRGEGQHTVASFVVRAGETVSFQLSHSASHLAPPPALDECEALKQTRTFWEEWAARCRFEGHWREAVIRSLITLKGLIYAPTGGIVAAATTSLPEHIGGARNWDYRFCWLRDATFTLLTLMNAGYYEEAERWRDWLVRALAGAPDQAQILYGLAGERHQPEWELSWLPGYEGSTPVRVGNAAAGQCQLDVYGEVADALHHARRGGLAEAEPAWAVQRALTSHVMNVWEQPDEGIWEVRGPRQHFTYSKVMAWVALDRAIKAVERYGLTGPVAIWRETRARIHRDVCERGYDSALGSFVQSYGSRELDASALLIPLVGFLPPHDPRVASTVAAINRQLRVDGLIRRYHTERTQDGLPPGEGAFIACTFWYVDNLVLLDRRDEATEIFQHLLSLRNDVGLLSEEYDPVGRRQLGNFPQAFSHVALVDSACNLTQFTAAKPARQRSDAGDGAQGT